METVQQIPYGVADFESVIERDLYYVDKTIYLAELEKQPDTLIFIRPRRFGKSLTMSMLHHYYDINAADKFERLYGNLYIGKNPTSNRNKYLVMNLNFAVIICAWLHPCLDKHVPVLPSHLRT